MLNKGKPSREHTFPAIKAALQSMLLAWGSPFVLIDIAAGCRIEALACDITCWLHTPQADAALASFLYRSESPRALNKVNKLHLCPRCMHLQRTQVNRARHRSYGCCPLWRPW